MRRTVYLDTAYVIALASEKDAFHQRATEWAQSIANRDVHVLTTRAVLLEIGNAFGASPQRSRIASMLAGFEVDPGLEIVGLNSKLYLAALELYSQRSDKQWSLADCVSFVVMRKRKLSEPLTSDHHYNQAGFRALLREGIPS